MRHYCFVAFVGFTAACAATGSPSTTDDAASGPDASAPDASPSPEASVDTGDGKHGWFCGQPGRSCNSSSDCCSGECVIGGSNGTGLCYDPPTSCTQNGGSCIVDDECCSLTCTNGTCAQGCAELWTDCSSASCCSGSCSNDVCQILSPICAAIGASCSEDSSCCSGVCTNGACAQRACAERGVACTSASDCCTGACSNGTCVDKPQCSWTGSCSSNFQCCTGTCNVGGKGGQCEPPVGDTVCQFLERGEDGSFADCFDCMATSCCDAEYASLDWTQCFRDCMSSFDTWDSWATCESTCNAKVGPAPDALTSCVQSSCSTACKVQP